MINSIPTTANTFSEQAHKKPPLITVFMYRVLLLGVGGGLAGFLGIVLATLYPNPHAQAPLLVQVLNLAKIPNAIASFQNSEAATIASANVNQGNTSAATPELDATSKAQLQTQLAQLQAQMQELSDRAATIENQLGTTHTDTPIEARLQAISNQLAAAPNNQSQSNQLATAPTPKEQTEAFKLTLPSDLLFQQNYTMLNSEASTILDSVINDLRSYKGATIRIAVHTNSASQPEDNRELSFRRAQSVQQYLAAMLGNRYRWVVIGYGDTRPLVANGTEINQQRNRRLEISISTGED